MCSGTRFTGAQALRHHDLHVPAARYLVGPCVFHLCASPRPPLTIARCYMQRVLIIQCLLCKVSLFSAYYAKCRYLVLTMQSVLFFSAYYAKYLYLVITMHSVLIQLLICTVSLLCSALYAKCPYFVVLCMQRDLIIYCFICILSVFVSALYATWPYYSVWYAKCPCFVVLYKQSDSMIWCFILKVSLFSNALYIYKKCLHHVLF